MKIKTILGAPLTAGLLVGLLATPAPAGDKLEAEAKVSKADATKTALAKVPGGEVKESELEKEHGVLIWSFDIATKGSEGVTEVNVDAITGKVASVKKESAAAEAKEKSDEAKENKTNP